MGKNSFYKKRGKLSRRNKTLAKSVDNEELTKAPHSFVIHRGSVGKTVKQLQQDFRRVMEPFTATKLMERRKNCIKDFVSIAGPLNVSHLVIFTRTKVGLYMKLMRLPRGPTLTFKIMNYCLSKDVISSVKKQMTYGKQFQVAPCLMTNLQPREGEMKLQLSARMFLDMFPTITPTKAAIESIRRSCLINYDPETELYDFRHYSIRVVPVGVSKAVKKFMGNKLPDLSRFNDVSEFMTNKGIVIKAKKEDVTKAIIHVYMPKMVSIGSISIQKSSGFQGGLGADFSEKLIKVEEGLQDGTVLYHRLVTKTEGERKIIQKKREKKKQVKAKRKQEQKENVENKSKKKEEHKQKCLAGMNLPEKPKEKQQDGDNGHDLDDGPTDDTDGMYYVQPHQQKFDAGGFYLFSASKGKKRKTDDSDETIKKKFKKQMDMKKEKEEEKEKKKNKGKWWERGDSDEDKKEKKRKPKYKPQNEMEKYTMNKKKKDKVKAKKKLKTKKTGTKKGGIKKGRK
ncbi:unnamed protein product, partial [Meganyctiphanes norvegica]